MNIERYVELCPEQEAYLWEVLHDSNKPEHKMKCLCILMSYQRHTITALSAYFHVSRQTIYSWMNAYEQRGVIGLRRRHGQGRK